MVHQIKLPRAALASLALALAILLFLPACWTASQDAIPSSLGEKIPFAYSQSNLERKGKLYLSPVAYSNDYRFRFEDSSEIDCPKGTFRAAHVQGEVYALQVRCEDSNDYDIVFYAITSNHWRPVEPDSSIDMAARARRYNVKLEGDSITGDTSDVYKFLRSLTDVQFGDLGGSPGTWERVGVGDYPGADWSNTPGSTPNPDKCTSAHAGQTAVCWDGSSYRNNYERSNEAWCTYKTMPVERVRPGAGSNPGITYVCRPH